MRLLLAGSVMSFVGTYSGIWLASAGLGAVFSSDAAGFAWFAAAVMFEWVFTNGPLKQIFRRARPDNSDVVASLPTWLHPPRSSSFPSGHSAAGTFAATLWWMWSPVTGLIAAAVALAMGASRVIVRAHHRTDVVAGWIWGILLALFVIWVLGDRLPF